MKAMNDITILALAGSARKASFNQKLVNIAADGARAVGAEVIDLDLNDYSLPIINQDFEAEHGAPEAAKKLYELFVSADGLLISCPEYNGSITPLLKNTIDWISRPSSGEPALAGFQGKVVGLMSASPGALGGLRGLNHVRAILDGIGCFTLPDQRAVPLAQGAFSEDGSLKDERLHGAIMALGERVATIARQLT